MTEGSSRALKRFSTRYVESEDRVRLTGRLDDGAPEVIWLTQRMLQRLIPALLQWLEGRGSESSHRQVLHAWAQQKARADLVPGLPIQPADDSRAWVARSAHIAKRAKGIRLTFKGTGDEQVFVTFTVKGLRQWLNIVYAAYARGGWPDDVWPDWIRESAAPQETPASALH